MIFQILFSLFLLFGVGDCKVNFLSEVKEEHESLGVMCRDAETGDVVHWRGPKKNLLSAKTRPYVKPSNFGLQLIFEKIRKEDAGTYICKSSSNELQKFELIVANHADCSECISTQAPSYPRHLNTETTVETYPTKKPAKVEFVDTPQEVVGTEGTNLTMRCEASGAETVIHVNGQGTNDTKFRQLGDGLLIYNLTAEDSLNEYICQATNEASGHMENRRINLTVQHPPRPTTYAKIVYGYRDGPVTLTCSVIAEPVPTFQWYQRDKKYRTVEAVSISPLQSVLMLVIKDDTDFGEYKCRVRNSLGPLDIVFYVLNGTRPAPPESFEILKANSSAIFFKTERPLNSDPNNITEMEPNGIRVEYKPEDEEFWNAEQFPLAEDDAYIVSNLSANTSYAIRVATTNLAGVSEFSDPLIYSTTSSAFRVSSYPLLLSVAFSMISFRPYIIGFNICWML